MIVAMTDHFLLGTLPAGSSVEIAEGGGVFAILPDGGARRFYFVMTPNGAAPIVETIPPVEIHFTS